MKYSSINKFEILNDPIYGYIKVPNNLIFQIIEDVSFQRLRRISQMGLSYLVYPGANHTRFHHTLGCLHLMQKTISVLRVKGTKISVTEENALYIAILLHDIGHGPFSHALEYSIVNGITHEEITLKYMHMLNKKFNGQLNIAIEVFTGNYHRSFLHQLISSQLDIDRLDYLKRDSFYTGVSEGNISSDRLIAMMNVIDDELVIEKKGVSSVENFLIARRFMYWQVYLHKTGLVAENILIKILNRAKELAENNIDLFCSSPLYFFLYNKINKNNFDETVLENFSKLDDYDILSAIKEWVTHPDKILSNLSKMIINRNLLKIEISDIKISENYKSNIIVNLLKNSSLTEKEAAYFVFSSEISNLAYNKNESIRIVNKNGELSDIMKESNELFTQTLSKPITKYFICYPKKMQLA